MTGVQTCALPISYQKDQFAEAGIDKEFVQDNQSRDIIHPLGFYRSKTQHLIGLATALDEPPSNGWKPTAFIRWGTWHGFLSTEKIACTVVRSLYHTINSRVAEVHVGACHVSFCPVHHFAFFYFTAVHFVEQFP